MGLSYLNRATRAVLTSAFLTGAALCGAQPAAALDRVIFVGTGSGNSADWILYIAINKGFFKDNNIEIDRVGANSTAAAMQQIAAGSGNIGGGGLTDPLHAIDKGAKLGMLRITQGVPPYTLWAKPNIKTFKDLKGKTTIVGGAKDITRIYFDRMVRPNGLNKGDVDLIYAGTTPARYAALKSGGADAAILLPPFSFRAKDEGYSLVGRLSDYVKDLPFTGYAVSLDWAREHKPVVANFMRAYQRANDWFYDPANKAEAVQILVKESRQPQADIEATYDYLKSIDAFTVDGTVTPASLATIVKALSDEGDLVGSADPARFIDPEIAKLK
jgi:ABC-type nitrate/sulfonate/bicarbonate transport system substrate-binding protein